MRTSLLALITKVIVVVAVNVAASYQVNAEVSVTDDTGTEVVLTQPARRVISLAPHITESVFAIGAGDKLVGVVNYSDYPLQAQSIPQVGSYKKVSYETIAAMQPDLILAFGSGNGWEMINHLRSLGFTVYVDEPRTLEDVANTLTKFGLLLGQSEQGNKQADAFLAQYQTLKEQYQDKDKVKIFYEVWNKPLLTISNEHLISDVIHLCGGKNIFDDAIPLVPKVSVEMVVRRNPDVIVASGMGEERPEWLDEWRNWRSIKAVQSNQLYFIPPDILQRHTPRILLGAETMCRYLDQARNHYHQ